MDQLFYYLSSFFSPLELHAFTWLIAMNNAFGWLVALNTLTVSAHQHVKMMDNDVIMSERLQFDVRSVVCG